MADAAQYKHLLAEIPQRVVAFGEQSGAHVRLAGYDPIIARDHPPRDYPRKRRKPRRLPFTDPHGRWVEGLSMWWRKLHAIRLAWDAAPKADAIVWLDWDTLVNRPVPRSLFKILARGPAIQGRVRQYFRKQVLWRKTHQRQVFHGGCFYVRNRLLLDQLVYIHGHLFPVCTDEVPITRMIDTFADDQVGHQDDTARLRDLGYDNPVLYSTRHDVIPSSVEAYFGEGRFTALRDHLRLSAAVNRP